MPSSPVHRQLAVVVVELVQNSVDGGDGYIMCDGNLPECVHCRASSLKAAVPADYNCLFR